MSGTKPNARAAILVLLVRKYPDTLQRLESLAVKPQGWGWPDWAGLYGMAIL